MRDDLQRLDSWKPPDQWNEIVRRTPGEPSPEPSPGGSRLVAALVATAVAVVGLGFGFLQLGGLSDDEGPSPREPVEVQHLVTSERPIDTGLRFPEGVVVGEGAVWVAARYANQEGGDLLRLDPSTGEEQARIPMPSLPGWTVGGAGITTGLGSVWIAAGGSEGHTPAALYMIDPSSSSLAATIDVGPGSPADVWVDASGIWVLSFSHGNMPMYLYKLDPVSHEVTATTEVPASWSQNVFAAGGWIYVWGSTGGTAPAETLFKVDPATAKIVDSTQPGDGNEFSIVASGDRIWFFHNGLRALDGATGEQVVGPLRDFSVDWCCSGLIADGRGGVWVTSKEKDEPASLWHLDLNGHVTASSGPALSREADGIAAAYDEDTMSVWFVHYKDTILRLGLEVRSELDLASVP